MRIAVFLVFGKIIAVVHFADVVIIRGNTSQKRICPDLLARFFCQLRHHHTVLIRSARRNQQVVQQRACVRVAQIHQAKHARRVQNRLKRRDKTERKNARDKAVERHTDYRKNCVGKIVVENDFEHRHKHHIQKAQNQRRKHHIGALFDFAHNS